MLEKIVIQIQNRQYLKNSQQLIAKFRQKRSRPRKHNKFYLNCSNCCKTLYITDRNTESESEDSDDITTFIYLDR